MHHEQQFESQLHRAVRKMIERKMAIRTFVTHHGQMIQNVNGYNLTAEQILELDSKGELTAWGITDFARKYEEELKNPVRIQAPSRLSATDRR